VKPVTRTTISVIPSGERTSEVKMDNDSHDRKTPAPGPGRRPFPTHKVAAAMTPDMIDGVVTALEDAGFARDRIEVVTAEDVSDLDEPIGGSGIRGFLTRFSLSIGDDLDEIEQARRELTYGHALVLVMVDGMAEQERAHAVLHEHGGHAMRYFGRWAITTYDDDAD
jgi:hypothetical protein